MTSRDVKANIRGLFNIGVYVFYFDYAASTPLCDAAYEELMKSMKEDFANPSAAHKLAKDIMKRVDQNRATILKLLGANSKDKFIFTGSASEANNMAIRGHDFKEGDEVLYSKADHPSTVKTVSSLEKKGCSLKILSLNSDAQIDIDKLEELVNEKTKLVVLAHVNNQSGTLQPLKEIVLKIKELNPKAFIHVDGVQAFGKIPFSLKDIPVDSYSVSGHKICGPKGVAGLYLKSLNVNPLLLGGGHEEGMRASTIAAPLIFSLGSAASWICENREEKFERAKEKNLFLREKLGELHKNISFPFSHESTSPYVLSTIFRGISSDILLRHLEMKEIYISSSSACSSKVKGENPGYLALGIDKADHKFILRISFGDRTSDSDFEALVSGLKEVINDISMLIK